jgi:hypothetical protein
LVRHAPRHPKCRTHDGCPDTPDLQAPKLTWVHWLLYNLPATTDHLDAGCPTLPSGTKLGLNNWHRKLASHPIWRALSPDRMASLFSSALCVRLPTPGFASSHPDAINPSHDRPYLGPGGTGGNLSTAVDVGDSKLWFRSGWSLQPVAGILPGAGRAPVGSVYFLDREGSILRVEGAIARGISIFSRSGSNHPTR